VGRDTHCFVFAGEDAAELEETEEALALAEERRARDGMGGLGGVLLLGRGGADGRGPGLDVLGRLVVLRGLLGLLDALLGPVWLRRAGVHLLVLLGRGGEEVLLGGLLGREERLADDKVMGGRLGRAERRARGLAVGRRKHNGPLWFATSTTTNKNS
jgi:hypothetical protein